MLTITNLGWTGSSTWVDIGCLWAAKVFELRFSINTTCFAHAHHASRKRADVLCNSLHFWDIRYSEDRKLSVFYIMKKTVRYRTAVDPDVKYNPKQFQEEIAIYLADPDGWAQWYTFVYAPKGPAKLIRLCQPSTLKHEGCKDDSLSCAVLGGNMIWLNADRWFHGSAASKLPLLEYRQYMVSHEMGHSLGHHHEKCPGSGPAPIMMQQTLGIGTCSPNTKVFSR